MSDTALSESAMLASLRDMRLPADAAGGMVADIAATLGLAGCAALVLAGLLRLFSLAKHRSGAQSPADRRADWADLPDDDRRLALLHLLRDQAPERYRAIRDGLYRPGGGVDLATLQAEVDALV